MGRRFDVPIFLHEADRKWVMRPSQRINCWGGETHALTEGLTVIRLGGHFPGGTVLHWEQGAERKGALLSGDIVQVVADQQWVSFMYSYPNLIPLSAHEIRRIRDAIAPFQFERLYGAWFERVVTHDAHAVVSTLGRAVYSSVANGARFNGLKNFERDDKLATTTGVNYDNTFLQQCHLSRGGIIRTIT